VSGIALDWTTRNIYWTDYSLGRIQVASASGQLRAPLITENISKPLSIVLDPREGYVPCRAFGRIADGKR